MKQIIGIIIINSILFSVQGVIIFNDQTIIEGNINGIEKRSVYITPEGLSFPEQILIENIDSLKIADGTYFIKMVNSLNPKSQEQINLLIILDMKLNMLLYPIGALISILVIQL